MPHHVSVVKPPPLIEYREEPHHQTRAAVKALSTLIKLVASFLSQPWHGEKTDTKMWRSGSTSASLQGDIDAAADKNLHWPRIVCRDGSKRFTGGIRQMRTEALR
jgi:hypothetical protein